MKILTVTTPQYAELTAMLHSTVVPAKLLIAGGKDNGSPDFGTESFNLTCKFKAQTIVDLMKLMRKNEVLFYVDSDVVLFEKPEYFKAILNETKYDLLAQQDVGSGFCMGFFVVRVTPKTIALFEEVARQTTKEENDQNVFNRIYGQHWGIRAAYFNNEEVFNYGMVEGGALWNGQEFELPKEIKAFHANFTIGLANKKKLLNYVLKKHGK